VLTGLSGVDVAHLACHGDFKRDNALFSTLNFSRGRLYLYDFEAIPAPPEVMVLAACDSSSVGSSGAEVHGLITSLLMNGVCSVVAAASPVPDTEETGETLQEFHRHLVAGEPPAVALATARSQRPVGSLSAGTFACYGWG
jgi:CHAT domain-containing protein